MNEPLLNPPLEHLTESDSQSPEAVIDDRDQWDDSDEPNKTCAYCSGTGGDPWNDGILPCEYCDGEGYEWERP